MLNIRQILFLLLLASLAALMYTMGAALSRYQKTIWIKVAVIVGTFGFFVVASFAGLSSFLDAMDDVGPSDMPPPFRYGRLASIGVLFVVCVAPAVLGLITAERKKRVQRA